MVRFIIQVFITTATIVFITFLSFNGGSCICLLLYCFVLRLFFLHSFVRSALFVICFSGKFVTVWFVSLTVFIDGDEASLDKGEKMEEVEEDRAEGDNMESESESEKDILLGEEGACCCILMVPLGRLLS